MTDEAPSKDLTTQQRAAIGKSQRNGVSGRLKACLDMMVWEALPYNEAAVKAGLSVRSIRLAMNRPHVLAYLKRERGVRLVSGSAKNLARLEELRDQDSNITGAVQAAKVLETMTNEAIGGPGSSASRGGGPGWVIDLREQPVPGLVIHINSPAAASHTLVDRPPAIDVTPNKGE